MSRRILILVVLSLLISCKGTKYTTGTSKTPIKKNQPTAGNKSKSNSKKPVKPVKNKPSEQQTAENLEATSNVVVYADVVKNYIDQYKETAKDNMRNHGIPASITLAQGILESGAGKGRLAQEGNNHFGIKCHTSWNGETIHHDDDALQECFRKYTHASESFRDHSLFLTSRSRYQNLFKLPKDDYKAWAKGLRQAGYATDPNYPEKLIGIIERYELFVYDNEVLKKNTSTVSANNQPQKENNPSSFNPKEQTHKVIQGDTLYNLSKRYNVSINDLKTLNNLKDNAISIGQTLIIPSK